MKLFYTLLLSGLFFCNLLSAGAQSISSKADTLLSAYYQQDLFTGTVIIAKEGRIVFEKSYGMANRSRRIENTSNTEYRICSLSKPITSLILMQLIEKGLLQIDDLLSRFLPEFPNADSITIRNLLNHTSGIRSITSIPNYMSERLSFTGREDVLRILKGEALMFSPGSTYQYSNSNYVLLSYIAELVVGKPMNIIVKDFCKQLGMMHTGMDYDGRISTIKALGYEDTAVEEFVPVADINIAVISGAGGMYSSARDLLLLDSALNTNSLVAAETKKLMFTAGRGGYGLGWEIDSFQNEAQISHSGSIEGFKSMLLRYPESRSCIIFLSNYWNTRGPEICKELKAIAFGQTYKMPEAHKFVQLNAAQLKAFEGDYIFKGAMTMKLQKDGSMLRSVINGQPVVNFRPVSASEFYSKSNNAMIKFHTDAEGKVLSFTLVKGKQEMLWERLGL